MTDDETPIGVDLEAWDVPPPRGGIADAVIARLHAPVPVAARETVLVAPRRARRWWLAGGAVAALAGVLAVTAVALRHAPAPVPRHGEVIAPRARHLALGASSAELDAGAEVRWQRRAQRLVIAQPRGAVTWRIAGKDTVVIDAGATVASVEATGASLRVEVQMKPALGSNVFEPRAHAARTIGTSAVTAAAVAMVTVVVYQGRVDVTSDGQTVRVPPGSTFEVRPDEAPRERLGVGAGPARVAELEARVQALEAQLGDDLDRQLLDPAGPARSVERDVPERSTRATAPQVAGCDEVACVLDNYAGACCAQFKREEHTYALGRDAISAGMARVKEALRACSDGTWGGTLKLRVRVAPDGKVTSVTASPEAQPQRCAERVLRDARFAATDSGGSFSYPVAYAATARCDAAALAQKGMDLYTTGKFAAALVALEQAYACGDDPVHAVRVLLAACRTKDIAKAQLAWRRLTAQQRSMGLSICVGNGISQETLGAGAPATPTGGARIESTPVGLEVLVEGKRVGVTPLALELAPGKHRVTYVVGKRHRTFTLVAEPGQTVTLSQDLR